MIQNKNSPAPSWPREPVTPKWRLGPDGVILSTNSELRDFAGGAPAALDRLLLPTDVDTVLKAAAAALASGKSRQLVSRLRRADGVYRRHLLRLERQAIHACADGAVVVLAQDVEEVSGLGEVDVREAAVRACMSNSRK